MRNETWSEICYVLGSGIKDSVLEKEYENAVVNCMMILGWKKFKGEIETQYAVQTGHEKKYADIVIMKDGMEQFVIEVKRPVHVLQEEDERQLFSYMRLLRHKVSFGLYIGDKIRLYYDDDSSQQFPEPVFSVEINENNPDGITFTELFSKDTFDTRTLTEFCKKQKDAISEKNRINEEVNRLLADDTGQTFKDLLRKMYLEKDKSKEWSDAVLSKIRLEVSPANDRVAMKQTLQIKTDMPLASFKPHDRTRYGLLGSRPLPKRKLVLEVVRNFVKNNPGKTYDEYSGILNRLRPDSQGVIRPLDALSGKRLIRYFTEEHNRFLSSDGVIFVVCNQWGDFNIEPVVKFAESQGYDVVRYVPED